MASTATPIRERKPSMSAPLSDLKGPVGPNFSRPKHKRTVTGFGPQEIKSLEALTLQIKHLRQAQRYALSNRYKFVALLIVPFINSKRLLGFARTKAYNAGWMCVFLEAVPIAML